MTEDKGTSKGLASALCSVTLISVAQLAMKWGMMSLNFATTDFFSLSAIAEFFVLESAPLLAIFFGLVCYALSMFFWLLTLKRLPLSFAYPILSLSYVAVYVGSIVIPELAETFTLIKVLGISLILSGLIIIFSVKEKTEV